MTENTLAFINEMIHNYQSPPSIREMIDRAINDFVKNDADLSEITIIIQSMASDQETQRVGEHLFAECRDKKPIK